MSGGFHCDMTNFWSGEEEGMEEVGGGGWTPGLLRDVGEVTHE